MTSAELCRKNQWGVGTVLRSTDGEDELTVRITEIGEYAVLAVGRAEIESMWDLTARQWTAVLPDEELLNRWGTSFLLEDRNEILRRMKDGRRP